MIRIGVDIGGTKIEIIVLDEDNEVYRKRIPTPKASYENLIQCVYWLVNDAVRYNKIKYPKSIGIGIPGIMSPQKMVVKNSNLALLNNRRLDRDIRNYLNCNVFIANDANCMALSEAKDGAGSNDNMVFGIILGTGCGGGIAISKHVHAGVINGLGGEWGHNPLPWLDEDEIKYSKRAVCYCGKWGCTESFLSGTGFTTYYQYRKPTSTLSNSKDIIALAEFGDALALECIELYENRLAKALASVVNIFDPDIIVAAGGMSNIERIYPNVTNKLKNWVFGGECLTKVVKSKHGDSSGVRGAAWLQE